MRLKISILPIFSLIFTGSAFAGVALPSVNVSRSVSAREMYGETPIIAKKANPEITLARVLSPKPVINNEILTPHRPSDNLWAESKEAPLRMPRDEEFVSVDDNFSLPEESLDTKPLKIAKSEVVSLRPETKEIVERNVLNPDALAKAYDAGRIAELQRIADKALTTKKTSKTRKLVVPMDNESHPAVASVRSVKTLPMTEEDFAYKNPDDMPLTKLSPMQLKRAFKKTYISENKHLSTYRALDKFDTASEEDLSTAIQGFDSTPDLSERSDIRPLEIKISFNGEDSSLSRDNYMLLSEYAGIVTSNPKRAIQVSIPEHATRSFDGRKLSAKRLAIIEQVLRDTGVSDQKIVPVLADRDDESLVLRVISNDVYQSLTQNRGKKSGSKSLAW